jgi:rhamnose transport system ATP-binding protein
VTTNVTMATLPRYTSPIGFIETSAERKDTADLVGTLSILTPSLITPVAQLSGGNQQKTMLAKWLNTNPRVLILDEPTRGIDVGAKTDVHHFIDELARSGVAIILISSDLPEVLAMSDRVLVMREGRVREIFDAESATQEQVMTAAVGTT